jgi:DNA-binding transcriptional LysR family regulator
VLRSDYNAIVQSLVAEGVGIAVVARLTIDPNDERTILLDLQDPPPPHLMGIAWHRDRELAPSAAAFVDAVKAVCARL